METYSIKDSAELLNVNEETVRRWIRSGKIKAFKTSNKEGWRIPKHVLYSFASSNPKYKKYVNKTDSDVNDEIKIIVCDLNKQIDELMSNMNALYNLLATRIKNNTYNS